MRTPESFTSVFTSLAPNKDFLVSDSMEQMNNNVFSALSPKLRFIAIDTASRVAALNREELELAIKTIDELSENDEFMKRDRTFPLSIIGEDIKSQNKNYDREMKDALAQRIVRRRVAEFMDYNPQHEESYIEIIYRDDFRNTCRYVSESIKSLV